MRRDRDAMVWTVLSALGIEDADLLPLGAGLASEAWRIGHRHPWYALRIGRMWTEGRSTFEMEHALMARLVANGARVPTPVRGSWELEDWSGPPFSFTLGLDGGPLAKVGHERAAPAMAAFLRTLHGLPIPGHGALTVVDGVLRGEQDTREVGLRAWAQRPLWPLGAARLDAHAALADRPALRELIGAHEATVRAALGHGPGVPLHSDLHEENILDADGELGFIDFGEGLVGPAAWEFAAIGYFLGWPMADATLAAYLDDSRDLERWRADASAIALCFGVYRWAQDRELEMDEDTHDEEFLLETLARL